MNVIRNSCWFGLLFSTLATFASGAITAKGNLLGKFYVSSASGNVICITDGRILPLKKGDTLLARGAVIEAKAGAKVALLFSNQTSVIVDENSRLEIETFEQEFFPPSNNLRMEPSNSTTVAHLFEGRVLISTPTLRSGTTMTYRTLHGTIGVRGEKVVIEASEKHTHVVVIAGAVSLDSRNTGGPSVLIGKRLITGEEAYLTNAGTPADAAKYQPAFQLPTLKRRPQQVARLNAEPKTVAANGLTVSLVSAKVLISTALGKAYEIVAGTAAVSGTADRSAIAVTLSDPNREMASVLDASLIVICDSVKQGRNQLSIESFTRLLSEVATAATKAAPERAASFATEAVAALTAGQWSSTANVPAAITFVVNALVTAAPASAPQIAFAAATVAPTHALVIAASAAKAAPAKAHQIAFAVAQILMRSGAENRDVRSVLRNSAALAAAVTAAAPDQAGPIAASVLQAWIQSPLPRSPSVNAEYAATIAAAVLSAAPSQSVAVVTAVLKTLTPTLSGVPPAVIAQSIATLGAAVASIVPSQAEQIASTLVQIFLQTYPEADPNSIGETIGLLAAAMSQAAPAQTSAINSAIAAAANLSLASIQAGAARSTALAAQIGQQLAAILQDATFALQESTGVTQTLAASDEMMRPGDLNGSSAVAADELSPSDAAGGELVANDESIVISPFDTSSLVGLADDLAAAQVAQTGVQFNTEPDEDGSPTLRPIPTTPPTLPVELQVSPANGSG